MNVFAFGTYMLSGPEGFLFIAGSGTQSTVHAEHTATTELCSQPRIHSEGARAR